MTETEEIMQLKIQLADAHGRQAELEKQIRHKDGLIYHLKGSIEHQRQTIEGLQNLARKKLLEDK